MIELRNDAYWLYVIGFVQKHFDLPTLGIKVLGYFPYHTAKIMVRGRHDTSLVLPPRLLFNELEELLTFNHVILDNKAVYICKPLREFTNATPFALMMKDDYVIIGSWEDVIQYDGHALTLRKQQ